MAGYNLCSQPASYSERDYDGYAGVQDNMSSPYGFHDLETENCHIQFGWVRANAGAPTYARIDVGATPTDSPTLGFDIIWDRMASGDFSWGTATIGLGEPGVGNDPIGAPLIGVEVTGETDIAPTRSWRGLFVNTAGTRFVTNWVQPHFLEGLGAAGATDMHSFRVWVDGSTGWITAVNPDGTYSHSLSVALTGSFSGNYSRWESHHSVPGSRSSNGGDANSTGTDKAALGRILSIQLTEEGGWRIGGIGAIW